MALSEWTEEELAARLRERGEPPVVVAVPYPVSEAEREPTFEPRKVPRPLTGRKRQWVLALMLVALVAVVVRMVQDLVQGAVGTVLWLMAIGALSFAARPRVLGDAPKGSVAWDWFVALVRPSAVVRIRLRQWLVVHADRTVSVVAQEARYDRTGEHAELSVPLRGPAPVIRPTGPASGVRLEFDDGTWVVVAMRRKERGRLLAAWPPFDAAQTGNVEDRDA